MKKNSIEGFEIDRISLEKVVGGANPTKLTNGDPDEVTMTGNKVDDLYICPKY